jgi:hypothetical protein
MKMKHFVEWCSHHTLNRAVKSRDLWDRRWRTISCFLRSALENVKRKLSTLGFSQMVVCDNITHFLDIGVSIQHQFSKKVQQQVEDNDHIELSQASRSGKRYLCSLCIENISYFAFTTLNWKFLCITSIITLSLCRFTFVVISASTCISLAKTLPIKRWTYTLLSLGKPTEIFIFYWSTESLLLENCRVPYQVHWIKKVCYRTI